MSDKMNVFDGDSLENIWRESIDTNLKVVGFPEHELQALKALGNQLGIVDVQVQMRFLDLYMEHLEATIKDTREQVGTKVRLCHYLGVMSGLFIAVLLF